MISQVAAYFRKLSEGSSKESSKRFMALFTMLLVSYVVIRYANPENCELILGELLTFILTISGVATWQNVKIKSMKKDAENEEFS